MTGLGGAGSGTSTQKDWQTYQNLLKQILSKLKHLAAQLDLHLKKASN